jgi:hypothetical protein
MSSHPAISQALDSGRRWTALPEQDQPLEWSMDGRGSFLQGPLEMEFFRGRKVFLNLTEGQLALLVEQDDLRAVYLDGGHILDVGTRPGQVGIKSSLIFLAIDMLPVLRWTFGNPLALPGPARRHIIGSCELLLNGPSRFHAAFLCDPANLAPEILSDRIEKTVRQCLSDYLVESCPPDAEGSAELQSILMNLQADVLSEELSGFGLTCNHLALYTSDPPVEGSPGGQAEHETAGHSPQLAHN